MNRPNDPPVVTLPCLRAVLPLYTLYLVLLLSKLTCDTALAPLHNKREKPPALFSEFLSENSISGLGD